MNYMVCRKCNQEMQDTPFCALCGCKQILQKRGVKKRGNGSGYARKRGNVWQLEVTMTAGDYKKTLTKSGFKTKREALEYAPILKKETAPPITMIALYDKWATKHYDTVNDAKAKTYTNAWNRMEHLWRRDITTVRYDELQQVVDSAAGYYPKRELRTVMRGIYDFARKNGTVKNDLSELIELPSAPKPQKEAFTQKEVDMMWQNVNDIEFLCYPIIMVQTGMRPGELKKLQPDMINFETLEIKGAGLKTEKGRMEAISFTESLVPILQKFKPINNKHKTWFDEKFKEAMTQIGVRTLTPGCCRHTTATFLAMSGTNPGVVQKIMRHTTAKTALDNYTHIDKSAEINALKAIFE